MATILYRLKLDDLPSLSEYYLQSHETKTQSDANLAQTNHL